MAFVVVNFYFYFYSRCFYCHFLCVHVFLCVFVCLKYCAIVYIVNFIINSINGYWAGSLFSLLPITLAPSLFHSHSIYVKFTACWTILKNTFLRCSKRSGNNHSFKKKLFSHSWITSGLVAKNWTSRYRVHWKDHHCIHLFSVHTGRCSVFRDKSSSHVLKFMWKKRGRDSTPDKKRTVKAQIENVHVMCAVHELC